LKFVIVGVGYTGKRVCGLLPDDQIHLINRSRLDDGLDELPHQQIDLDSVDAKIVFPAPCSVLYTVPPDSLANKRLANFLKNLNVDVKRFVYLSTTGVYGDQKGAIVNENVAPQPSTKRAKRRLAAEQYVLEWGSMNGVDVTILRVPGIYGPGRLGIERLSAGAAVIREADANAGNRIHVDDLAACCVTAMAPGAATGIFNVGDGDHRSSTWFAKTVAEFLRLKTPREVTREEALLTLSSSRISFLTESRQIDTSKMRNELGYHPRFANAEDGIRASL